MRRLNWLWNNWTEEFLRKRRRATARFELTSNPSAAHEFSTYAERIRMQYFKAFDFDILITTVEERFNQPDINQLLKGEELILLSATDYNNEVGLLLKTVL